MKYFIWAPVYTFLSKTSRKYWNLIKKNGYIKINMMLFK